ncbi:hypothetical protein EYZ11_005133 [Aspergillus tanneri]|uniref:Uncharacterized protein n=1 Tax=Aspergillus tanneri TaxID=1220188 RepID=A0A4S3JJB2_9EURO|nr:uncharacterized protein ATNIH1004_008984 [Aspergillus tanneri]KAA8644776.1 hypothetical protein ATNIH1004_008984 [Aspergillus tanneri]THC95365.1 hypothetical protein EYZ11_005133 [Aspergillus tanneri]
MRFLGVTVALVALAAAQGSYGTTSSTSSSTASDTSEPCARVSHLLRNSDSDYIPAEIAYKCLASVPVAVEADQKLIDELKLLWEWHSEVGWLKNPPSSWELGSVDLLAELDKIRENLGSYGSEYDVQLAIQKLAIRTGNFHFNYQPDILQVFSFYRSFAIATVSEDGTKMPLTYVAEDLILKEDDDSIRISPISMVNGQDVQKFLNWVASASQYTDPDARYNNVMYKANQISSAGSFRNQESYQGPVSNVTFANGTSQVFTNLAYSNLDFTEVTSGKTFFQQFCTGKVSGIETLLSSKKSPPHRWSKRQTILHDDYPKPVVEHSRGAVAGYFMTISGFTDVAVLKIISFDPEDDTLSEFQKTVKQFLAKCTQANKKKLIIDLRENGGGSTSLLLDTFMQLFPDITPFSGQRYRAQEQFKLIGDTVSALWNNKRGRALANFQTAMDQGFSSDLRYWTYWNFLDTNGETFSTWDDLYGPHEFNGDNFTSIIRYNLSNSNPTSVLVPNFTFLEHSSTSTPPFKADNIVIFSDGLCGSSCASFHEELKNIAGVKAVAVGGRAQTGPMQTIGGTKGGEVIPLVSVSFGVSQLLNLTNILSTGDLDQPIIQRLLNTDQVFNRAGDTISRLQVQDQVRKGDKSQTPLQYIYEAADCRLWYTAKMLLNPEEAWAAAWNAHTERTMCVEGSTNHSSSISGGFKPYGPRPLDGEMDDDEESVAPVSRPTCLLIMAVVTVIALVL